MSKKENINPKIEVVGVRRLAQLMTLDVRRCQQLANEGVVVKVSRGKYDLIKSLANYHNSFRAGRDASVKEGSEYIDPIKRLRYEREKMEFEQAQGKLVDRERARAEIVDLGGELRSSVMAISDRAPSMLVGKDMAEIRKILRHECGESLRDFARASRLGE